MKNSDSIRTLILAAGVLVAIFIFITLVLSHQGIAFQEFDNPAEAARSVLSMKNVRQALIGVFAGRF